MPAKRKVNLSELQKLRDEGYSVTGIAQRLGIGKGTVSKNLSTEQAVQIQGETQRAIEMVQSSDLNPMGKLEKIVNVVESELDKIRVELETSERKGPLRELQLKHSAEIRKQLELLLEISTTLYRIEEIEAFKRIVLEELGNESPELRGRVLERIKLRKGVVT